jgi:hypothetical protein
MLAIVICRFSRGVGVNRRCGGRGSAGATPLAQKFAVPGSFLVVIRRSLGLMPAHRAQYHKRQPSHWIQYFSPVRPHSAHALESTVTSTVRGTTPASRPGGHAALPAAKARGPHVAPVHAARTGSMMQLAARAGDVASERTTTVLHVLYGADRHRSINRSVKVKSSFFRLT